MITYRESIRRKLVSSIVLLLSIAIIFAGYYFLGTKRNSGEFFTNSRAISSRFSLTGFYAYTFNDIFLLFQKDDFNHSIAIKEIEEYIDENKIQLEENKYTGIFKDKNLIFLQLENMDTWMINEKITPTIKHMMDNGINFTNNWTPQYSKGYTFTTEFVLNTGLIPELGISSAQNIYAINSFPYSLANSFKNNSYNVNSYHYMWGTFYNRINNHKAWGYENYHSFKDMKIDEKNYTMDRYLAQNGYDKIVFDNKFMSYIITYSPHMPFNEKKNECKKNLDFVKKYTSETNISYLCAMAQAHETDIFLSELIERLENEEELEDTVIVGFTDHYAYSNVYKPMVKKQKGITNDEFKLLNTPFFIYNAGSHVLKYSDVTSTIDVIPTLLNMFGLKYEPKYYVGSDVFSSYKEKYAFFDDYSWFDGKNYYENGKSKDNVDKEYVDDINISIKNKLNYSKNVLKTNYFEK